MVKTDIRQRCHLVPGYYRVKLNDREVCDGWKPQHYSIQKTKDWRQGIKYSYNKAPVITHIWTKSSTWKLMPKKLADVIFPIAEVSITLCTKDWVCPAGTYKNTDKNSCVKCAAGLYRTSGDPEDECLQCHPGTIELSTKRDFPCSTGCPAGKYCLAGAQSESVTHDEKSLH